MSSAPANESAADILSRFIASNASALGDVSACISVTHNMPVPFERRDAFSRPVLDVMRQVVARIEALSAVDPTMLAGLAPPDVESHLTLLVALASRLGQQEAIALGRSSPGQLKRLFDQIAEESADAEAL